MKTKRNVQLPETRLRGMLADSFMRGQECERTSYEMSRAEAEAHANRFVDEYLKAGHIVPAPSLREALEAVEAEPELPGEMPEEMWDALEAMRGSVGEREAMTEAFRIVVQLTKKGIADRLRALAATEDQGEDVKNPDGLIDAVRKSIHPLDRECAVEVVDVICDYLMVTTEMVDTTHEALRDFNHANVYGGSDALRILHEARRTP